MISALSDRLSIDLTTTFRETPGNGDGSIDIDIDIDSEPETSLENLIEVFDDPDPAQRETIANEFIEVCNSIREHARQKNVGNQALNAISSANSKLMSADLSKADPGTYDSIRAQLAAVKTRTEALEKTLVQYSSIDPSNSEGTDE